MLKMDKTLTKRKPDSMETGKSHVSYINKRSDISIRNPNQGSNEPIMYPPWNTQVPPGALHLSLLVKVQNHFTVIRYFVPANSSHQPTYNVGLPSQLECRLATSVGNRGENWRKATNSWKIRGIGSYPTKK